MNAGDLSQTEIVFVALATLAVVAFCALHAWLTQ